MNEYTRVSRGGVYVNSFFVGHRVWDRRCVFKLLKFFTVPVNNPVAMAMKFGPQSRLTYLAVGTETIGLLGHFADAVTNSNDCVFVAHQACGTISS